MIVSPRVISSHRANTVTWQGDGRLSVPYVLLYYLPENCNPSQRMMYAGATELMRTTAEVNRVIEVESEDDIISIATRLSGSE